MTPHDRSPAAPGWRERLRAAGAAVRAMIGVPDYERYLAHVATQHPGETPLSRDEFAKRRLEDRYARPGSRCC